MTNYQPSSFKRLLRGGLLGGRKFPLTSESLLSLRVPNPLPAEVVFTSTPPVKHREFFHYLYGPGLLIAIGLGGFSNGDDPAAFIFGIIFLISGLILAAKWYAQELRANFPTQTLIISRSSIQIPPTGEFLWPNIEELFIKKYSLRRQYLMIRLRNGTLVEHRLPRLFGKITLGGNSHDHEALRFALCQYWLEALRSRSNLS